ncbi:MAG: hypothetical protein ACP5VR_12735 [Acidimicrobiales bacterium]
MGAAVHGGALRRGAGQFGNPWPCCTSAGKPYDNNGRTVVHGRHYDFDDHSYTVAGNNNTGNNNNGLIVVHGGWHGHRRLQLYDNDWCLQLYDNDWCLDASGQRSAPGHPAV